MRASGIVFQIYLLYLHGKPCYYGSELKKQGVKTTDEEYIAEEIVGFARCFHARSIVIPYNFLPGQ